jgi:hypothetical protein
VSTVTASEALAVPPPCVRFYARRSPGFAELRRTLEDQAATQPQLIRSPREVLLSSQGLLQGRYRFTTIGLRSFCQALSPGLSSLAADVSGLRRRAGYESSAYSLQAASRLINDVVRLRFDQNLRGCYLVVDPRSNTVEGLVGPRYEFFSNLRLLDLASEFLRGLNRPMRFAGASLSGRRMLLRYYETASAMRLTDTERFCRGWGFSNSETGEAALRICGLACRAGGGASAWEVGRCVHIQVSQRKLSRLQQRLVEAAAGQFEPTVRTATLSLRRTSLQLGSSHSRTQRVKTIVGKLSRTVGNRTAQQVVRRLLGPVGESVVETPETTNRMTLLSGYDLYNAVTSVAATLSPGEQERAEGLAHRIFTGQLRF